MKLGICTVYLVPNDYEWLLALHLDFIQRNTEADYTIYAAIIRSSPETQCNLSKFKQVKIIAAPITKQRYSSEHGYYLDFLVQSAIDDGCTHICTLDLDSFPIRPDWDFMLASYLRESQYPFCAVLRKENLDKVLPHPCGLFAKSSFIKSFDPRFNFAAHFDDYDYTHFLYRAKQRPDTGIGYSFTAAKNNLNWGKLYRSNSRNDHYLMGGIYGDIFFHLGAVTRKPLFYADVQKSLIYKLLSKRLHHKIILRIPKIRRALYRNEIAKRKIEDALQKNPSEYIRKLCYGSPVHSATSLPKGSNSRLL